MVRSFTFFPAFFFINVYQNDITADLADLLPGDDIFRIPAEDAAEPSGTGDDQCEDTAVFLIDEKIHDAAQGSTGTDIDDFFLTEFQKTQMKYLRTYSFYNMRKKSQVCIDTVSQIDYTQNYGE